MPPLLDLDYIPKLPAKADYGIGIVGAGQIVNQAHLPAYRKAGFRVLAIADIDRDAAQRTATRFDIPRVYASIHELVQNPEIEIADIAVPARDNLELGSIAIEAGKHVLIQKPMAETVREAEALVNIAREKRRKLAVNQQMRWSPSVRAAADLLRRGLLGEALECSIQLHVRTPWDSWPWLRTHPYPELYYHSIHHVDTLRFWLGNPKSVYATLAHFPTCSYSGPTRNYMLFDYPGNLRAFLMVNHHSAAAPDDLEAKFLIEGAEGRCEGVIGLLLNYPAGRSDVLAFSHRHLVPNGVVRMELTGRWFPDAFVGPMSSLMDAVTSGGEPETSGEDVLQTMRLIEAIQRSHETKQAVQFG